MECGVVDAVRRAPRYRKPPTMNIHPLPPVPRSAPAALRPTSAACRTTRTPRPRPPAPAAIAGHRVARHELRNAAVGGACSGALRAAITWLAQNMHHWL